MLKNRFHFWFRMGAKHNSFSQFHVRKNYASHPSELIRIVRLQKYLTLIFFLSIIFTKSKLHQYLPQRNLPKSWLVARRKIVLPCCADRDQSRNVQRSHSPFELKPLEGGGMGGAWCRCSVAIFVVSYVFLHERCGRFLTVRGWSQEGSKVNQHAQGLVYFKYTLILSFQIISTYVGLWL